MRLKNRSENGIRNQHRRGFPLTWHAHAGQFVKVIDGKQHRFGADPKEAERSYLKTRSSLEAGIDPVDDESRIRVRDLCNKYLDKKSAALRIGEIKSGTFGDYRTICKQIVDHCGHRFVEAMKPLDFGELKAVIGHGAPESARIRMTAARSVFKFAYTSGLIDKPVRYGDEFNLPSNRLIRVARAERPSPTFDAETVRKAIDAANGWMKAAVMLGINCGMYSKDISDLRNDHFDGEFIDNVRLKTGAPRRCWLWPITRDLIEEHRYGDNEHNRVFLSADGGLINIRRELSRTDLVASNWKGIKRRVKLTGRNTGFKNLRHTFRTEADQTGDQRALFLAMAHLDESISAVYTHRVDDERLINVAQHVHKWLFGREA